MKILNKLLLKDDHVCPWWLAYTFDNPLRRLIHDPRKILGPYLKEGMTAADLGCGMGYFSVAMAELVGSRGEVISVDVQQKMLDILSKRAMRKGVLSRITTHQCSPDSIGLDRNVDFALSFWMVHETPDIPVFFGQLLSLLKPGGKYLVAEPGMHVSAGKFKAISAAASSAGFEIIDKPSIALSRTILLRKTE